MTKRRFGLSLLTALALVLMFSVSVMAAVTGVTIQKATVNDQGVLTVDWNADAAATDYTVTVKDVTANADKTADASIDKDNTVLTLATAPSTKYEVTIVTVGGANNTGKTVFNAFTPASNKEMTTLDVDNGIVNANKTGTGVTTNDGSTNASVIKSSGFKNDGTQGTQRTHGEYQNNTNSCASCHQTHTGASKSLLFKDGVYNTCTACHDGTLGFYNVFEHSNAGTFGGTTEGNMSVHLADGTVQMKAAPGGNLSANSGSWVNEFNCASCHSPHGSYSDRLLQYNPNGMGIATKAEGGIGLKGNTVYDFASKPAAVAGLAPIVVRGTGTELGITGLTTEKVIAVMELSYNSTTKVYSWKTSTTPWLYGYVYGSPKNYYTRFFEIAEGTAGWDAKVDSNYSKVIDNHDDEDGIVELSYAKGYVVEVTAGALDAIVTANIARAYVVDLDLVEIARFGDAAGIPIYTSNVNALTTGIDSKGVSMTGAGVKMSTYCAACHTDYLAKSGTATGTWNQAFRHTTDSDSYTCVRCHYSHGTDVNVMMDAHGETVADLTAPGGTFEGDTTTATNYMLDKNPSSALKRYTNMSVCWGCHTDSKAEQLKNTSSYTGLPEDPHGLNTQPQMPGATSAIGTNSIFAPLP